MPCEFASKSFVIVLYEFVTTFECFREYPGQNQPPISQIIGEILRSTYNSQTYMPRRRFIVLSSFCRASSGPHEQRVKSMGLCLCHPSKKAFGLVRAIKTMLFWCRPTGRQVLVSSLIDWKLGLGNLTTATTNISA